ncbi:MAG: TRL domain-containing protein [Planctomycetota bacterium]|jgi:hypothetical protein
MVRRLLAVALVFAVLVLVGCHTPLKGVAWAPIVKTESLLELGDTTVGHSKMGEASWEGIMFLVRGDASLEAAMEDGGITSIHHVDLEQLSVLGVYTTETIRVFGE